MCYATPPRHFRLRAPNFLKVYLRPQEVVVKLLPNYHYKLQLYVMSMLFSYVHAFSSQHCSQHNVAVSQLSLYTSTQRPPTGLVSVLS